jgi:hypothetical protein
VLTILRNHELKAKLRKCSFGQKQVEYLSHIISGEGVATDPTKIADIVQWKIPKSIKKLRGFLGLTGYTQVNQKIERIFGPDWLTEGLFKVMPPYANHSTMCSRRTTSIRVLINKRLLTH